MKFEIKLDTKNENIYILFFFFFLTLLNASIGAWFFWEGKLFHTTGFFIVAIISYYFGDFFSIIKIRRLKK